MRSHIGDDQARQAETGRELDRGAVGRPVAVRKWWVIGPALLCFIGALIFVSVVQPRYTAESKVLVENGENYFTRPDRLDQLSTTLPDDETVQSQIQLVQSRDIARQAIRRLELKGNPEFDPVARGLGPVSRLLIALGIERDPTSVTPEDRILAAYSERLTVFSVPKSRVIAIEFTATDPELAARAANTIAELVIEAQSAAKRRIASTAAASLASLLTDLRARVAEADTKADAYRTRSGLLLGSNNTAISTQQLGDLNSQLTQARTAQADAEAKAKLIKDMIRQNRVGEIPDVANNDFIRRISEQRGALRAEIALQTRTLLPGHPRMQELYAQLADVDAQLRAAGEKQVRTLENDARITAGRVENLVTALEVQKKAAGAAGADQVHLNTLETQARLLKEQLEFNTTKYQEALARENASATPADARIISRASPPQLPSFPKRVPIVAIVTIAGLVLSLGFVVARELLSGRAFAGRPGVMQEAPMPRVEQIAKPVPVPLLAPEGAGAGLSSRGEDDLSAALAAIRGSRTAGRASRLLVLPPAARGEAPAAALALARRLAAEGRAILVDAHGRTPAAGRETLVLDASDEAEAAPLGLAELLAGQASFAEVIHRDALSRLHVVPAGERAIDTEMLGAAALVLDALSETYDFVVMNAPPPTDPVALRMASDADEIMLVYGGDRIASDLDAAKAALVRSGALARPGAPGLRVMPASAFADRDPVQDAA